MNIPLRKIKSISNFLPVINKSQDFLKSLFVGAILKNGDFFG
jgi:hypothetical protein